MPKKEYADFVKGFFEHNSYGPHKKSNLPPDHSEVALAYINYCFQQQLAIRGIAHPPGNTGNNVSILADETSLSFITKRAMLVADTTILTHQSEKVQRFKGAGYVENTVPVGGYPFDPIYTNYYIRCPDLSALGKWLNDSKPLLLKGDVFYIPNIVMRKEWDLGVKEQHEFFDYSCELIVKNRRIFDTSSLIRNAITSKYVRIIAVLDLPVIENVDLDTFCKIASDESDAIERFRDLIRRKILEIRQNEENDVFHIPKIEIELREGVLQLKSDFATMRRKAAFQATKGSIITIAAALLAVSGADMASLVKALGSGGGVWLVSKALEEYLGQQAKLKESPYYFLWLLSRKQQQ